MHNKKESLITLGPDQPESNENHSALYVHKFISLNGLFYSFFHAWETTNSIRRCVFSINVACWPCSKTSQRPFHTFGRGCNPGWQVFYVTRRRRCPLHPNGSLAFWSLIWRHFGDIFSLKLMTQTLSNNWLLRIARPKATRSLAVEFSSTREHHFSKLLAAIFISYTLERP